MKDIKKLKRYTKKDFLNYAHRTDTKFKKDLKKWLIDDFRDFYGFTHKNIETGEELDVRGINCMGCFSIMKNDEHSSINKNYCIGCL